MFKVITKPEEFLVDPPLEMDITEPTDEIELYGKKYRMYKDDWKHHVHLKCTNRCDACCKFCIERSTWNDKEDANAFMESTEEVVSQLRAQGHFKTLSVTGGEPTLFCRFGDLLDYAREIKPMLFSVNSNGCGMNIPYLKGKFHGWFNLSKHAIYDSPVFGRSKYIMKEDIEEFKRDNPDCKVRIQCVLGLPGSGMAAGLANLDDVVNFVKMFNDVVDDFSFRSLIIEDCDGEMSDLFRTVRQNLFKGKWCVQQVIQDYYVYEDFKVPNVKPITISWSNMALLRKYNETHKDNNFLEEIIVHPDGAVTGSWNKQTLIIKPAP